MMSLMLLVFLPTCACQSSGWQWIHVCSLWSTAVWLSIRESFCYASGIKDSLKDRKDKLQEQSRFYFGEGQRHVGFSKTFCAQLLYWSAKVDSASRLSVMRGWMGGKAHRITQPIVHCNSSSGGDQVGPVYERDGYSFCALIERKVDDVRSWYMRQHMREEADREKYAYFFIWFFLRIHRQDGGKVDIRPTASGAWDSGGLKMRSER